MVFRNTGAAVRRRHRSERGAADPRSSRGAAFGDYDNDGDEDVLVMNMNEPPSLLRNDYRGSNRWLSIRLIGHVLEPGGDRRDRHGDRRRRASGARGGQSG